MKNLNIYKFLLIVNFFCVQTNIIFAQTGAVLDTSIYFNEVKGLVIAEMESIKPTGNWLEKTDRAGFTGTSFFEWGGADMFGEPGSGLLTYVIKINSTGQYKFEWRSKIGHGTNGTEANDSWLKIPNAKKFYALMSDFSQDTLFPHGVCTSKCPHGAGKDGWYKVFVSGAFDWSWSAKVSDSESYSIYADFDKPGFYTVQISGRSSHHLIDRFVLYKLNVFSPNDLSKKETKVSYVTSKAKVGFRVRDNSVGVFGVSVFLKGVKKTSDAVGGVFYYDIPVGSKYDYKVQKTSYWDVEGNVLISRDTIITVNLNRVPDNLVDIKFSIKNDGGRPMGDTKVTIGEKVKYTDISGVVFFEGYNANTPLTYIIEKNGYINVTGNVAFSKDTVINAILKQVSTNISTVFGAENSFQLKPNPVQSFLSVNSTDIIQNISVVDINGRLVFNKDNIGQNSFEIDVCKFIKGVYFIKLKKLNCPDIYTNKFIKD